MSKSTSSGRHRCVICDIGGKSVKKHDTVYYCVNCFDTFKKSPSDVTKAKRTLEKTEKKTTNKLPRLYTCVFCKEEFPSKKLKKHTKPICSNCGKKVGTARTIAHENKKSLTCLKSPHGYLDLKHNPKKLRLGDKSLAMAVMSASKLHIDLATLIVEYCGRDDSGKEKTNVSGVMKPGSKARPSISSTMRLLNNRRR